LTSTRYARPEIQPVNARAESVAEKPMFKEAYRKRRCIVPMDAFYEKKKGRLYKFFMKDRPPFGVAGIWENWRNPSGDWERTFCIITVEANDLVRKTGCRRSSPLGTINAGSTGSMISFCRTPQIR
jgi:putative SOS response-associated peptidase YedK